MADKYVQLHPTNAEDNIINEEVKLYPIIGPGSFKDFETEGEIFAPQKKLVPGTNLKNITIGTQTFSLLGANSINLNAILLDLLYPVGSVYTSVNDPYDGECPIRHTFGIGTWERITDTFLYAKGEDDVLGATGGSKDAIVVAHNHSVTGGAHTHPITIDNVSKTGSFKIKGGAGSSVYPITSATGVISTKDLTEDDDTYRISTTKSYANSTVAREIDIDVSHNHTATIQSGSGSHTHNVSTEGVSGEGKNMPPYLVVMAWKRIA